MGYWFTSFVNYCNYLIHIHVTCILAMHVCMHLSFFYTQMKHFLWYELSSELQEVLILILIWQFQQQWTSVGYRTTTFTNENSIHFSVRRLASVQNLRKRVRIPESISRMNCFRWWYADVKYLHIFLRYFREFITRLGFGIKSLYSDFACQTLQPVLTPRWPNFFRMRSMFACL